MVPNRFFIHQFARQALGAKNFRVDAGDEYLLKVGAVEYADLTARRQLARGAPQKIVFQLLGARVLEAEYLAALRVDSRHDVLDAAVLTGCVHGLENEQQRVAVGGVQQFLLCA